MIPCTRLTIDDSAAATFEDLLARELAKEQTRSNDPPSASSSKARAKRPFLKRGDRGWWMNRPGAQARVVKHALVSKDIDSAESTSSSRATTYATSTTQRSAQQLLSAKKSASRAPAERQQRQSSDAAERTRRSLDNAPRPQEQQQRAALLAPERETRRPLNAPTRDSPSPPPPPPVSPQQSSGSTNDVRQSVDRTPLPRFSDSMRTTASADTLGMSRVRQSYEAQRDREADELAAFEAIERELAAEKDSYLIEKRQPMQGQQASVALLGRQAPESPWRAEQHQQQQYPPPRQSTLQYADFDRAGDRLDFDGHSSLLFDDRFDSESLFSQDERRGSELFAASQRPYPASELSAISLNDSQSWADNLTQQHTGRPAHNGPLGGATARHSHGYGSFDDAAPRFRGSDEFSDALSESRSHRDGTTMEPSQAPPVSTLIQQFFRSRSSDDNDEDDEFNTSRDSDQSLEDTEADRQPMPQLSHRAIATRGPNPHAGDKRAPSARVPRLASSREAAASASTRSQANNRAKQPPPSSSSATGHKSRVGGAVLPVVIEEKLFELEEEVRFYKAETLQLQKKKDALDQAAKKLAREREDFARFQDEQRARIAAEWEQERAKMRRDEKLLERQVKLKLNAAASHHDRKERGEIDALKAQIVTMQLDEKARAAKWKAMNDNLRQRVVVRDH